MVAKVFLHQASQWFLSLKLEIFLDSFFMLRLKDSIGVKCCEELPDDPANSDGGLEVTSEVDSSIHVLA